ncbi:hypothetical protein VNO77_01745 [Canavalia gladiata]|uniref:Uncharacterized protein n=1 Tax=Canavalia gladiata TaxID=3824 RepID=A0AAN9R2E4_CANGL
MGIARGETTGNLSQVSLPLNEEQSGEVFDIDESRISHERFFIQLAIPIWCSKQPFFKHSPSYHEKFSVCPRSDDQFLEGAMELKLPIPVISCLMKLIHDANLKIFKPDHNLNCMKLSSKHSKGSARFKLGPFVFWSMFKLVPEKQEYSGLVGEKKSNKPKRNFSKFELSLRPHLKVQQLFIVIMQMNGEERIKELRDGGKDLCHEMWLGMMRWIPPETFHTKWFGLGSEASQKETCKFLQCASSLSLSDGKRGFHFAQKMTLP